jgi:hypothetical protein
MDQYIGKVDAEWVDPAVELPPDGWEGMVIFSDGTTGPTWRENSAFDEEYAVAAWLRIGGPSTAIPREKVQAAVDRIRGCSDVLRREGYEPIGHDNALMHIANSTGITPSGVQ